MYKLGKEGRAKVRRPTPEATASGPDDRPAQERSVAPAGGLAATDDAGAQRLLGLSPRALSGAAAFVVGATALALTFAAWHLTRDAEEQRVQHRFEMAARAVVEKVETRMAAYEQVLRGGVGLFNSSETVTRDEWFSYTSSLQLGESYPGIQGMGYAVVLAPDDVAAHVATVRQDGFPEYRVWPDSLRDVYTSIVYLEPFDVRNRRAFGFDMMSEPTRAAAMARARDTGRPSASGRVVLVQEDGEDVQAGFLTYLPVYKSVATPGTVAGRRAESAGYVYAAFRMNDLMRGLLDERTSGLTLRVHDGVSQSDESLLYAGGVTSKPTTRNMALSASFSDRTWTLSIASHSGFDIVHRDRNSTFVLAGGSAFTLLLMLLVWSLANNGLKARSMVHRMSAAERRSREIMNAIIENVPMQVYLRDRFGRHILANREAERFCGLDAGQIIGTTMFDVISEKTAKALISDDELVRKGATAEHDFSHVVDGEVRYYWSIKFPVPSRENGPPDIGEFVIDITDYKRAEDELIAHREELEKQVDERTREAETGRGHLETAIEAVDAGFGLVDAEGRLVMSNAKLEEFFPEIKVLVARNAHVSEAVKVLFPNEYSDECDLHELHSRSYSERRLPDGRWVSVRRSRTPDGGGIAFYTDITEIKQQAHLLERQASELKDALAKEKELNELQGQFVSMASHEFRTPLAIIDSTAQRLISHKDDMTPELVLKRTEKIRRAVDRMSRLMESTLSAVRLDSGQLSIQPQPCDLRAVVEDAAAQQGELNPEFEFVCDIARLPETVRADDGALAQILANLLSNAVKYSAASRTVDISSWADDDTVYVTVSDHGLGIAADELPKMFTRYFRAKSSTGIPGTGIGLNLARSLARAHGGDITVESVESEGSTFTVILPVSGPTMVEPSDEAAA